MSILSSLKSLSCTINITSSSSNNIYNSNGLNNNNNINSIAQYSYPYRIEPRRRPYDTDGDFEYIKNYYSTGSNYYL